MVNLSAARSDYISSKFQVPAETAEDISQEVWTTLKQDFLSAAAFERAKQVEVTQLTVPVGGGQFTLEEFRLEPDMSPYLGASWSYVLDSSANQRDHGAYLVGERQVGDWFIAERVCFYTDQAARDRFGPDDLRQLRDATLFEWSS